MVLLSKDMFWADRSMVTAAPDGEALGDGDGVVDGERDAVGAGVGLDAHADPIINKDMIVANIIIINRGLNLLVLI